jgi:hypothetical protein
MSVILFFSHFKVTAEPKRARELYTHTVTEFFFFFLYKYSMYIFLDMKTLACKPIIKPKGKKRKQNGEESRPFPPVFIR